MKKRLASILSAFVLGLFIANVVISPVIQPAYAAGQTTNQDQTQQSDAEKKDNSGGHSGHH